ncbi:MAG TPA: hypothetical protein DGG94_05375 [Micromonosporaceae bacterium]|nr:hypothetical protein [Micromonosporaceae bacterium]HCU49230.1 hypothetical protein [Micromonosporaceae bacterium]
MRTLTSPTGTKYSFDPASLCLEVLLTGGPGPFARHEILSSPADLVTWLAGSWLGDTKVVISEPELAQFKRFRDTLWVIARAVVHGDMPSPADLAYLNSCTGNVPEPQIDPHTRQSYWRAPVSGAQVIGAAAREAIDLLSGEQRLRECSAHDCYLLFVDTSRAGNRRWCSMERCGNRSKVRSHRARINGPSTDPSHRPPQPA